jgi:hypothetical protein
MPGNFLHGVTENMQHLARATQARAEDYQASNRTLASNLEPVFGTTWIGAGSQAASRSHDGYQMHSGVQVVHPLYDDGMKVGTAANHYDAGDLDAASIANIINPGPAGTTAAPTA